MIELKNNVESLQTNFREAKKNFDENQTKFFENIIEVLTFLPENIEKIQVEIKKKSDKELLFKSVTSKANSKDVANGFTKLKQHFERINNDKKMDFICRSEIGAIIKDNLLLKDNEQFSFGGYYEKLNNINTEKMFEKKFGEFVKKNDFLTLLEQRDLTYVKKEEIFPIRELINEFQNKMDNFEIENRMKFSNYDDEIKETKNEVFTEMNKIKNSFNNDLFIKKKDFDFFDKEIFNNLDKNISELTKLNLGNFCEKISKDFKNITKKIGNLENKNNETFLKLENNNNQTFMKLENKNENNKNELNLEYIKFKNEILKNFEMVEDNKNKEIRFEKLENDFNEMKKNYTITHKNLEIYNNQFLELTSRLKDTQNEIKNFEEITEKILNCEKNINSIKNDILNKEKLSKSENTDKINNLKVDFFSKIKKIKKEIKHQKINTLQSKLKISSKETTKTKQYEILKNQRLTNLEKEIQSIKLKLINTSPKNIVKSFKNSISPKTSKNDLLSARGELLKKSDLDKICTFLDQKADIKDINDLMKEIYEEIDKLPIKKNILKNVQYIWKSGKTVAGRIPWEIESFNNLKKNFFIEKNKFEIVIVEEGLYEIGFGVFGRDRPEFRFFLNGENIVSSKKMKLGYGEGKFGNKHSNGNVVGLTLYDYFVFPFNSHIWFEFAGDFGYEGFLKITKM